jgi:archaetidylinositol phosphate synthase
VSYVRARAEVVGVKLESVGLAERAERIIILLAATFVAIFWQPITVMSFGIILLALLTHFTVLERSVYVYAKLKKKQSVV